MYIGNTNTRRLHIPGCRAVGMIADKHRVTTDSGEGFPVNCKWCGAGGYSKGISRQSRMAEYMDGGIIPCNDPYFHDLFMKAGCLTAFCKGFGQIFMFRDPDTGTPVQGQDDKWWVFMECDECGYQTAWWKAEQRVQAEENRHTFKTAEICQVI
jgi:hypothetical protein